MGVEFTDNGIRVKKLFRRTEIPYRSIEGCMFGSCSKVSFECKLRYMAVDHKLKEITVIKSEDGRAHKVYVHILQTCSNIDHKIAQYPCPNMITIRKKLESFGSACEFIEPDADAYALQNWYADFRMWETDLGGYILDNPFIKEVLVKECGKAEYISTRDTRQWYSEREYNFNYVIRDSRIHQIDCGGNLQKQFGLRVVDFIWDGLGSQALNDDEELRRMLMKTKPADIKLENNSILLTDRRRSNEIMVRHEPSEPVFRCVERIAEHMLREPVLT